MAQSATTNGVGYICLLPCWKFQPLKQTVYLIWDNYIRYMYSGNWKSSLNLWQFTTTQVARHPNPPGVHIDNL